MHALQHYICCKFPQIHLSPAGPDKKGGINVHGHKYNYVGHAHSLNDCASGVHAYR